MSRRDVARADGRGGGGRCSPSLDDDQRALAAWPFPADDERRRWFYTPTDHGGLTARAMGPAQQQADDAAAAQRAVAAGYVTATTIIGLENVLDEVGGLDGRRSSASGAATRDVLRARLRRARRRRRRGAGASAATTCRSTTPSSTASWSPRRRASSAPTRRRRRCSGRTCCGRWPAPRTSGASSSGRSTTAQLDRGVIAPVAPGRPGHGQPVARRRRATGRCRCGDLAGAARRPARRADGARPRRRWSAADRAAAGAPRRRQLHHDAEGRAGARRSAPASASCCGPCSTSTSAGCPRSWPTPRRPSTPPTTPSTSCRSPGPAALEPGQPHYYRVQGGTLLAEYDNTQRGVNHVHTVWRDLRPRDFGGDVLADHYAHVDHHRREPCSGAQRRSASGWRGWRTPPPAR